MDNENHKKNKSKRMTSSTFNEKNSLNVKEKKSQELI